MVVVVEREVVKLVRIKRKVKRTVRILSQPL